MNAARSVLGIIVVLLMGFSILGGVVSMNNINQLQWRKTFAWSHLDLAQASSDVSNQYDEITRAIQILNGGFPQTGNYDFFNKLNPKANFANVWSALYEVQNYTYQTSMLNKTDAAYNIAVYNNQEKIVYFESNYGDAFENYMVWGAGGWVGGIAAGLAVIWMCLWAVIIVWATSDSGLEAIGWLISSIPIWVAFAIFIWFLVSPVLYTGLT